MYGFVLGVHNLLRWVAVIMIAIAFGRAIWGWLGKREWLEADRKTGLFATISVDMQLLFGLILYFISPITKAAFSDFGAAMGVDDLRFFALEHVFYMVLAFVFAHLGSVLPKRASDALGRHRRAAIFFGLALLLILLGIPWGRPLLPGLG